MIQRAAPRPDQGLTADAVRAYSEDVSMGEDADSVGSEDIWGSQSNVGITHYVALDTNILISNLSLVKTLHRLIYAHPSIPIIILIPSTVINELDKLQNSVAPDRSSSLTVGDHARSATAWLLEVGRRRRESGWGVVRCQRWVERLHRDLQKPDDRILDCCLYFLSTQGGSAKSVLLWTDDRNLSVLAEGNDVPTIGGRNISLDRLLHRFRLDLPKDIQLDVSNVDESHGNDGEMELDIDLIQRSPSPGYRNLQLDMMVDDSSSFRPQSHPSLKPLCHSSSSSSSSPTKSPASLAPLLPLLVPILRTLLQNVHTNYPSFLLSLALPPTTLLDHLELVMVILTYLETQSHHTHTAVPSQTTVHLLQAVSSVRTMIHFLDPGKARRPRRGELADALLIFAEVMNDLAIMDGGEHDFMSLAERIRTS